MMVRSCVSLLSGALTSGAALGVTLPAALAAGAILATAFVRGGTFVGWTGALVAAGVGATGGCGGRGIKNFAHAKITAIPSTAARSIRSSGDNSLSCLELTGVPRAPLAAFQPKETLR